MTQKIAFGYKQMLAEAEKESDACRSHCNARP
jgi:hypothetical protein